MEATTNTIIIEENQNLWGTERLPAGCPECERVFLVFSEQIDEPCPLCRKGKLSPQPARIRPGKPEKWLPFQIQKDRLATIYQDFVSGVWIKPEDFTPEKLINRTVPLFWPLWLVDCGIEGHWQMEAGFDYQVESTKENYQNGRWVSRKQIEDRTRWEPRLGKIATHLDNIPAPALEDHRNRIRMTGNYPLGQMQDVRLESLEMAMIECPDLPPDDAWPLAKPRIDEAAGRLCQKAAGAQHQKNFIIRANYTDKHWTQYLLPVYITYYLDDDGQPQVLIVNGQSGEINGPRLASRKRGLHIAGIIVVIAGALFLLALIGLLLSMVLPPLGILAVLLGGLGFGLGIAAIIPAVWPARWNSKQQDGPRLTQKGGNA
ncbi:MAG: hypothetical protein ACOCYU_06500 [Brevefilum sp.]